MKNSAEIFNEIIDNRRSYRLFDTGHSMPVDVVKRSLAPAIKSPNSSNMQLWEFYRVKSKQAVQEVARICLS